jgi:hypothetical protein
MFYRVAILLRGNVKIDQNLAIESCLNLANKIDQNIKI